MNASLFKPRAFVRLLFRPAEGPLSLMWAIVVGVTGAFVTVAFRTGIDELQRLFGGEPGNLIKMADSLPLPIRVALPALGGLLAGICIVASRRVQSQRNVEYMEAASIGDGIVPVWQSLWRSLSSLFTISSGGSIGREGSMVQLAALAASVLGRWSHFDPTRLRLLVACGAAAGITSAYNAPIAGVFFVTEIVLGSMATEKLGPILVSSVAANITMREFANYRPTYEMPVFPPVAGGEVLLFVMLGLLSGVLAPHFLRFIAASKKCFSALPAPLPLRLALGGLIVGLISIRWPEVWGNGYEVVNSLLHHPWTWRALVSVLAFKIVATAATAGSGAIGGIFTPTLFVGAVLGCLFGLGVHAIWPDSTSAPFAYAMVGMGAFLAAATHAPLMAILMIFELTLSYQVMLPLMLSCVIAYLVARASERESMYEVTLRRSLEKKKRERLAATRMRELVKPADTVVPLTADVEDMTRMFLAYSVKYLYVVDEAECFVGVVSLKDITSDLLGHRDGVPRTAAHYLQLPVHVLTPDMSLADALKHFLTFHGERLPVVESNSQRFLLGVVYKTSLLDAFHRMNPPSL
ncbi:ClcB-like voltage-gated chloride channel protein [Telluria sp. Tellsp104]